MTSRKSTTCLPELPVISGVLFHHVNKFPGYCIGDDGSVWTCRSRRKNGVDWFRTHWNPMTVQIDHKGYPRVQLRNASGHKNFRVHALVLTHFRGPCPEGMQACHDPDPTKTNVRLSNLHWGTQLDNIRQRNEHGNTSKCGPRGMNNRKCKIPFSTVIEVRRMKSEGYSDSEIAKATGISEGYVTKLARKLLRKEE